MLVNPTNITRLPRRVGFVLGIAQTFAFVSLASAQDFEAPAEVSAAVAVAADLRSGQVFTIKDPVHHDGLVYTFDVESPHGPFSAEGAERLRTLGAELKAVAALKQLEGSETFRKAASTSGKNALEGMKDLVTSPVDTLKQAGSGLGRMFKRAGESFRSDKSEAEDSALKSLLGVSKVKREYAKHLGIDPYSANPVLQDELDKVAWTAFSGGLGVSALTAMIPGAVGVFAGFSGKANMLQEKIYATAPEDLRMENRKALLGMGLDKDLADAFIDNGNFSPTEQTLLVGALNSMPKARGRSAFIAWAAATPDADIAFVRRRMAEMFGAEQQRAPIIEFRRVGPVPAGMDSSGNALVCLPADRLLWTRDIAAAAREVDEALDQWKGVRKRVLIVGGSVSQRAHKEFASLGWTIRENQTK